MATMAATTNPSTPTRERQEEEDAAEFDDSLLEVTSADSQEVDPLAVASPAWKQLWQRVHCVGGLQDAASACHNPLHQFFEDTDLHLIIAKLLEDLQSENPKLISNALYKLYRLTDKEHAENRIMVVCTTRYTLVQTLVQNCIAINAKTKLPAPMIKYALLILNNLCVPVENKAAILLGEAGEPVLSGLLGLCRQRGPIQALPTALACLYNLSLLEETRSTVLTYCPASTVVEDEYKFYAPTEHPLSTLRTLESLIQEYTAAVYASGNHNPNKDQTEVAEATETVATASVEEESLRWGMAALAQLLDTTVAVAVAQTTSIPLDALTVLARTRRPLAQWTPHSLEAASMLIWTKLTLQPESCVILQDRVHPETLQATLNRIQHAGIYKTQAMGIWKVFSAKPEPSSDNSMLGSIPEEHDEKKQEEQDQDEEMERRASRLAEF